MVNGFLELHIWNIRYLGEHSFLYRWLSCALAGGLVDISSRFLQSNLNLEVEGEISSSRKGSVGRPSLCLPSNIQSWLLTKLEIKNSQQLSCYSFRPYRQSLELLLFSLFRESLLATTCRIILYTCPTHEVIPTKFFRQQLGPSRASLCLCFAIHRRTVFAWDGAYRPHVKPWSIGTDLCRGIPSRRARFWGVEGEHLSPTRQ